MSREIKFAPATNNRYQIAQFERLLREKKLNAEDIDLILRTIKLDQNANKPTLRALLKSAERLVRQEA